MNISPSESREMISAAVPVNVPVKDISEKILIMVRANPKATAQKMALTLGVTDKTIKRHLKVLREQGRLKRVGSDKTGHWEIIRGHSSEVH